MKCSKSGHPFAGALRGVLWATWLAWTLAVMPINQAQGKPELSLNVAASPLVPIRKGEVVGTIFPDTPGGPHLHFEIRANDDARTADPSRNVNGYYASHQAITDFGYIDPSKFLQDRIQQ